MNRHRHRENRGLCSELLIRRPLPPDVLPNRELDDLVLNFSARILEWRASECPGQGLNDVSEQPREQVAVLRRLPCFSLTPTRRPFPTGEPTVDRFILGTAFRRMGINSFNLVTMGPSTLVRRHMGSPAGRRPPAPASRASVHWADQQWLLGGERRGS